MPRSLLDDPAFASIGRTPGSRPAPRRGEPAKLALAVAMLIAAGVFFAWHAGAGRGPEPIVLTPDEADVFAKNTALGEEMSRQPGTKTGTE
ncbi:MAG: hypothetical protein ACKVU4_13190 [Phycisphaerales bacterium]